MARSPWNEPACYRAGGVFQYECTNSAFPYSRLLTFWGVMLTVCFFKTYWPLLFKMCNGILPAPVLTSKYSESLSLLMFKAQYQREFWTSYKKGCIPHYFFVSTLRTVILSSICKHALQLIMCSFIFHSSSSLFLYFPRVKLLAELQQSRCLQGSSGIVVPKESPIGSRKAEWSNRAAIADLITSKMIFQTKTMRDLRNI